MNLSYRYFMLIKFTVKQIQNSQLVFKIGDKNNRLKYNNKSLSKDFNMSKNSILLLAGYCKYQFFISP